MVVGDALVHGQNEVIEFGPQRCGYRCECVKFGYQLGCQCPQFRVVILRSPSQEIESLVVADAVDEPQGSFRLLDLRAGFNDFRQGLVEDVSPVLLQPP